MKARTLTQKLQTWSGISLIPKSIFAIAVAFTSLTAYSQVVINENDFAGNANVALDIQSTTKGVLFPVMTTADRNVIKTPATGLTDL